MFTGISFREDKFLQGDEYVSLRTHINFTFQPRLFRFEDSGSEELC